MGSILHTFAFGCKRARKKAGFTQQRLADAIGVSVETVRNWEQGRVIPEHQTIGLLCDFFKCDIDYLFGRIDYETHDLAFICEYTGLSEDAAKVLHYLSRDNLNVISDVPNANKLSIRYINRELGTIYSAYKDKIDACDRENLDLIRTTFYCMEKYVTSANTKRKLSKAETAFTDDERKSQKGHERYNRRIDFAEKSVRIAGSVDEVLTVGELYSEYLMNSIRESLNYYRKQYKHEKHGKNKEE